MIRLAAAEALSWRAASSQELRWRPREPTTARASDWQTWADPSIVLSASRPLAMVSEISEMNYRRSPRDPVLSPSQPLANFRNVTIIIIQNQIDIRGIESMSAYHSNAVAQRLRYRDRSCGLQTPSD
ncbi:hypothetical protein BDW71DRAFT_128856 [Aspergillus fruticulosus]